MLARHRAVELDSSHAAYDEHPLDEPNEWGGLASHLTSAYRELGDRTREELRSLV